MFQTVNKVYQFQVVTSGLNITLHVFTKLSKVLKAELTGMGVNSLFSLDDWLVTGDSFQAATFMVNTTIQVAQLMGFLYNFPKSSLMPSQSLIWLGMVWNTRRQSLQPSDDHWNRIMWKRFRALSPHTITQQQ